MILKHDIPAAPFSLNQGQSIAVAKLDAWRKDPHGPRFMSLTGPAGSGKTQVLKHLVPVFGKKTVWSGTTGKAASRMREVVKVGARTVYAVLYHAPKEIDTGSKIDLLFEDVRATLPKLLVVDESSMMTPRLKSHLDKSAYDRVLLVGDYFQLPPVLSKSEIEEQGEDYSVFSYVEGPYLDQVMRASGAVLDAATTIREKQIIPTDDAEFGGSKYEYIRADNHDECLGQACVAWLDDRDDHALITYTNNSRSIANEIIREQLGYTDPVPQVGEPVVICKNVYKHDVMNSDIVFIDEWLKKGPALAGVETQYVRVLTSKGKDARTFNILVPMRSFDGTLPYVGLDTWNKALAEAKVDSVVPITHGYCLTAHKCQGSEFRRATTFLMGDLQNRGFTKSTSLPDGSTIPFSTRFLYSSATRARNHATIIIS